MTQPRPRVAILSIGDMGMGIAKLLISKGYPVSTNCTGRSQETVDRADTAGVALVETDVDLVRSVDVVLSVVPPRDAMTIAERIAAALPEAKRPVDGPPLYFADMNAVAPETSRQTAALFEESEQAKGKAVRFVDGCILGGPPQRRPVAATAPIVTDTSVSSDAGAPLEWYRPLMPLSGDTAGLDSQLIADLNGRPIGDRVGAASGLKMCFAAMSKGYAAIAIQAFTTAHRLGILPELQWAMGVVVPGRVKQTEGALVTMAPKAYRWVREMEEIRDTFADEGGFPPDLFQGAAEVFRAVAQDTVLGLEKIGARKRGRTAADVAAAMSEGMEATAAKKPKKEQGREEEEDEGKDIEKKIDKKEEEDTKEKKDIDTST